MSYMQLLLVINGMIVNLGSYTWEQCYSIADQGSATWNTDAYATAPYWKQGSDANYTTVDISGDRSDVMYICAPIGMR